MKIMNDRIPQSPYPSNDRICFLSFCPSVAGITTYQALQIRFLQRYCPRLLLIDECPDTTMSLLAHNSPAYIEVFSIPLWRRPLGSLKAVYRKLRSWRPSIIVISNIGLMILWGPLLSLIKRRWRFEVLHVYHSLSTIPSLKGYLLEFLTSVAHLNADHVVYVSSFTRRAWEGRYPWMRRTDVLVVPNAVPVERALAPRVQPLRIKIGFVGRVEEDKDPALYCRVVTKFIRQVGAAEAHVFGDGSLLAELVREFSPMIEFHGISADKRLIYESIDLLLITSLIENAPYAILEAKERGIPVVAPAIGGIPEIVEDGKDGILVSNRSEEALVDALCRARQNYALLSDGCLRSRERFDIEAVSATMWNSLFKRSLNTRLAQSI
jgi:glycosyltransferase involved in cell wall biosynthesis